MCRDTSKLSKTAVYADVVLALASGLDILVLYVDSSYGGQVD